MRTPYRLPSVEEGGYFALSCLTHTLKIRYCGKYQSAQKIFVSEGRLPFSGQLRWCTRLPQSAVGLLVAVELNYGSNQNILQIYVRYLGYDFRSIFPFFLQ